MMVGNDLPKCEANYGPLTPITFLQRAAAVYPDRASVLYGRRRFTWAQTLQRCRRLASALQFHDIAPGDTVGAPTQHPSTLPLQIFQLHLSFSPTLSLPLCFHEGNKQFYEGNELFYEGNELLCEGNEFSFSRIHDLFS